MIKVEQVVNLLLCDNPNCNALYRINKYVTSTELVAFVHSGELLPCGHKPAYFVNTDPIVKHVKHGDLRS